MISIESFEKLNKEGSEEDERISAEVKEDIKTVYRYILQLRERRRKKMEWILGLMVVILFCLVLVVVSIVESDKAKNSTWWIERGDGKIVSSRPIEKKEMLITTEEQRFIDVCESNKWDVSSAQEIKRLWNIVLSQMNEITNLQKELDKVKLEYARSKALLMWERIEDNIDAYGITEEDKKSIIETITYTVLNDVNRANSARRGSFISIPLLAAQIDVESNFKKDAIGTYGEIGLMQLMPDNIHWAAEEIGYEIGDGPEEFKTEDAKPIDINVELGTWLLNWGYDYVEIYIVHIKRVKDTSSVETIQSMTLEELKVKLALSVYNRGPKAVTYFLEHGDFINDYQNKVWGKYLMYEGNQ